MKFNLKSDRFIFSAALCIGQKFNAHTEISQTSLSVQLELTENEHQFCLQQQIVRAGEVIPETRCFLVGDPPVFAVVFNEDITRNRLPFLPFTLYPVDNSEGKISYLKEKIIIPRSDANTFEQTFLPELIKKYSIFSGGSYQRGGELGSGTEKICPGLFGGPKHFQEWYRQPIEKLQNKEILHKLRCRIRPFLLRRKKENVAQELPPKTEQIMYITMNEPQ